MIRTGVKLNVLGGASMFPISSDDKSVFSWLGIIMNGYIYLTPPLISRYWSCFELFTLLANGSTVTNHKAYQTFPIKYMDEPYCKINCIHDHRVRDVGTQRYCVYWSMLSAYSTLLLLLTASIIVRTTIRLVKKRQGGKATFTLSYITSR